MHLYPSKWYLPSEPHIYVPLVNVFWPRCPRWWLALWARLGVRNEHQGHMGWKEVVDINVRYLRARPVVLVAWRLPPPVERSVRQLPRRDGFLRQARIRRLRPAGPQAPSPRRGRRCRVQHSADVPSRESKGGLADCRAGRVQSAGRGHTGRTIADHCRRRRPRTVSYLAGSSAWEVQYQPVRNVPGTTRDQQPRGPAPSHDHTGVLHELEVSGLRRHRSAPERIGHAMRGMRCALPGRGRHSPLRRRGALLGFVRLPVEALRADAARLGERDHPEPRHVRREDRLAPGRSSRCDGARCRLRHGPVRGGVCERRSRRARGRSQRRGGGCARPTCPAATTSRCTRRTS